MLGVQSDATFGSFRPRLEINDSRLASLRCASVRGDNYNGWDEGCVTLLAVFQRRDTSVVVSTTLFLCARSYLARYQDFRSLLCYTAAVISLNCLPWHRMKATSRRLCVQTERRPNDIPRAQTASSNREQRPFWGQAFARGAKTFCRAKNCKQAFPVESFARNPPSSALCDDLCRFQTFWTVRPATCRGHSRADRPCPTFIVTM